MTNQVSFFLFLILLMKFDNINSQIRTIAPGKFEKHLCNYTIEGPQINSVRLEQAVIETPYLTHAVVFIVPENPTGGRDSFPACKVRKRH